ncbi:MAG: hypothetical protein HDT44_01090, partial [Ruminococcaceae bacterium]|nr:hypothetical protein [Oscillospiraceae bacterium]
MKVHIKALTLLLVGVLVINCLSFGVPVFAVSAPSPGISTPFNLWPQNKQDPFRKAVEQFIYDLFGYSPSISYVDNDGTNKTATASSTNSQVQAAIEGSVSGVFDENGNIIDASYQSLVETNRLIEACLDEYCKAISESQYVGLGKHVDGMYISFSAYEQGITNILNRVGVGANSGVSWGLDMINGVPHNKVEISSPLSIPCFDYLKIPYQCYTNIEDPLFDIRRNSAISVDTGKYNYYYPFFITSDKTLYCLTSIIDLYRLSDIQLLFYNPSGKQDTNSYGSTSLDKYRLSFRFFNINSKLYPSFYFAYYSSYYNSLKKLQRTYGYPALSSLHNLFSDDNSFFDLTITPTVDFKNVSYVEGVDTFFYSPLNKEYITSEEILEKDISLVGVFFCNGADRNFLSYSSSTVFSAANLLPTYDSFFTGGSSSTTSPLSDWQKAIYILAQQQGTTYEELLKKLDMIIDSQGNLTIVGADGIEYKVDELSKTFDEIYSKVDDIASSTSELLEYLKSLNIESLGDLISALEGTLNDLNERDKDQTA